MLNSLCEDVDRGVFSPTLAVDILRDVKWANEAEQGHERAEVCDIVANSRDDVSGLMRAFLVMASGFQVRLV